MIILAVRHLNDGDVLFIVAKSCLSKKMLKIMKLKSRVEQGMKTYENYRCATPPSQTHMLATVGFMCRCRKNKRRPHVSQRQRSQISSRSAQNKLKLVPNRDTADDDPRLRRVRDDAQEKTGLATAATQPTRCSSPLPTQKLQKSASFHAVSASSQIP